MRDVVRYVGSAPDYEVEGDVVCITHKGMDPLAMPLPAFRAAVFKGIALIKKVDEERRSKALPVALYPRTPKH